MKEWNEIIKSLQNPDTVAVGLTDLDEWKKDNDHAMQAFKDKEADNDKRIRDLQDSNMKLYLRVTGNPPKDTEDEHEPETFDELLDKIKKENKDNGNN